MVSFLGYYEFIYYKKKQNDYLLSVSCFKLVTTTPDNANKASVLGITIKLLNISESSQTKSFAFSGTKLSIFDEIRKKLIDSAKKEVLEL